MRPKLSPRRSLGRDRRAVTAVETALVMLPFILLLLGIIQIGVYFMAKSALDIGVLRTAAALRDGMQSGTFTAPSAASVTSSIAANAGGFVTATNLTADLQLLSNLTGGNVPIADGAIDVGVATNVLVLRASAPVVSFVPGMNALTITAVAVIRHPVAAS